MLIESKSKLNELNNKLLNAADAEEKAKIENQIKEETEKTDKKPSDETDKKD